MSEEAAEGQTAGRMACVAAGRHEGAENDLSPAGMTRLLNAAQQRRQDPRLIQNHTGGRDPRHTILYTRALARPFEKMWW